MAIIPLIDKTVETRPLNAPTLGNSIRPVSNPYVESKTGGIGDALIEIADKMKQRADQTTMLEVQKKMDDWEAVNMFDPQNGALTKKGKDAFGLPIMVSNKFNDDMKGIYDGLANEDQRIAMEKMVISRRDSIMKTLFSHERQQMDGYQKMTAEAASDSSVTRAALNFNNPDIRDAAIQTAKDSVKAYLMNQGAPQEAIDSEMAKVEAKGHLSILTRMADDNPRAAIEYYRTNQEKFGDQILAAQRLIAPTERKYKAMDVAQKALGAAVPATTPENAIKFVMYNLEGGDKVVADGGAEISKFGVRSGGNRSREFVKNLTPEQAAEIYKKEYLDWAVKPGMSPDFALVAFDAAVQHGADPHTQKMIDEANGDAQKLIELRKDYYNELAAKPENAKNLNGWMNRLAKVQGQVAAINGAMPEEGAILSQVDNYTDDIELAADAKQVITKRYNQMKEARAAGETEAARQVSKLEADGQDVPPSLIARMSPEQQKSYYAKAYNPSEYERVRAQVAFGNPVDLEQYRFRIPAAQYDDLVKMQGDPVAQETARTVDKQVADNAVNIVGKALNYVQKDEDFKKISDYRKLIYNDIQSFERSTGKKATPDDVEKIADRVAMGRNKVSLSWGQPEEVKGVPRRPSYQFVKTLPDGTKMVKNASYADLVSSLSTTARANGIPVTPENLARLYAESLKAGRIFESSKELSGK